ncbi:MAG: hypothetical protein ABFD81_17585 [Syntrophaceae bacterium]
MRLITQSEAADIKGVSKVAIHKLSRRNWGFFVSTPGEADQVDISHPDWERYLAGVKPSRAGATGDAGDAGKGQKDVAGGQPGKEKKPKKPREAASGEARGNPGKAAVKKAPETVDIDEFLDTFVPLSLKELKTQAEVQRLNIEIHARLGELIDRRIVDERLGELSRYIQMFVDLERRLSARICQKLDRIGMEREVEAIIGPEVSKIIQDFKLACQRKVSRA